jgi:hypothetical protein
MIDDHSKRDFMLIVAAVVIVVPLTVWMTVTVLNRLSY